MKIFTIISFLLISVFGYSQNFEPDASIWKDPWISCQKIISPKSDYGISHWIQYDLGHVRKLSKTWVWNVNDPEKLDQGFRQVKIDYSRNGINWTYFGEMTFPKGEGRAIYGGFEGPDLLDIEARFVLLTVVDTYGEGDCAGITEIKFNLRPPLIYEGTEDLPPLPENHDNLLLLYPNPAVDQMNVRTPYDGPSTFKVFTIDGRLTYERTINTSPNRAVILNTSQLVTGMYIIQVENEGYRSVKRFVVR